MKKLPHALLALALATLAGCAGQAVAPQAPAPAVAPASASARYLAPGEPDLVRYLPPPPAAGSPEQARDLAAVLDAQAARTPARVEVARLDQEVTVGRFADVLGPGFTAERLPRTFAVAGKACREASMVIAAGKRHWNRPRPYRASPAVQVVVTNATDGSYPSGHAACGYLWSILMADLLPDRRDALFARGIAYGESRTVGGVHYPTDTAAGRTGAAVIAAALFASPAFRADLEVARAELEAAGLAPAAVSSAP